MKRTKIVSYELFLHYKQGDDFAGYLRSRRGNVPRALIAWQEAFIANADACRLLSEILATLPRKSYTVEADTHSITFVANTPAATYALDQLAKAKVLQKEVSYDEG